MGDRDREKDKKEKESEGKRQNGKKGVGVGVTRKEKVVIREGNGSEEKRNPGLIVKEGRPRSTSLSDGS